jgi:spermidine/putrescine transport system permease protein
MRTSLIGTVLLVFTLSMDEIAVTFFLIGRQNTLPLEIWSRLRRDVTPEMNAISTLIFLFSVVLILVWQRVGAARTEEPGPAFAAQALQEEVNS